MKRIKLNGSFIGSLVWLIIIVFPGILLPITADQPQLNRFSHLNSSQSQNSKLEIQLPPNSALISQIEDADVFSNEFYIEQLHAEIDGEKGIMHHALFSDRSMIELELDSPIFDGVSFCICQTNNLEHPFSSNPPISVSKITNPQSYSMLGFFYLDHAKIHYSPEEGINFLTTTFESYYNLEFKFLNTIHNDTHSLYPFFANPLASPGDQLNSIKFNLRTFPLDGYFRYLFTEDCDFLSNSYYSEHYFEENIIFLDSLSAIPHIQTLISQNYKKNKTLDTSSFYFDFEDVLKHNSIFTGLSSLNVAYNQLNDIELIENPVGPCYFAESKIAEELGIFKNLQDLNGAENVLIYDLAIEMPDSVISKSSNLYTFDLKKILNLPADWTFSPSNQCFNSISGLLSGISATLHAATVYEISPSVLSISRENTAIIEDYLFTDIQNRMHKIFQDYQFRSQFHHQSGISMLHIYPVKIYNLGAEVFDLLEYILPLGIPVLSGILIGDLSNVQLKFSKSESPVNLQVYKTLNNGNITSHTPNIGLLPESGISSINATISFDIELKNIGKSPVWGIPIRIFDYVGFPNRPANTKLTQIIRDLGYDVDSMFSSEIPHYFPIDAFGQGYFSSYSPDLFDISNLNPYSIKFAQIIEENFVYLLEHSIYNEENLNEAIQKYQNQNSIYNPSNWYISPGESRRITVTQDLRNKSSISSQYTNLDQINRTYEISNPAVVKYSKSANSINIFKTQSNAILFVKNHSTVKIGNILFEKISVLQAMTVIISKIPNQTPSNNIITHNISVFNIGKLSIYNLTIHLPVQMRTSLENTDFQQCDYKTSGDVHPTIKITEVPQNSHLFNISYQSWNYRLFNLGSGIVTFDFGETIYFTREKSVITPINPVIETNNIIFSEINREIIPPAVDTISHLTIIAEIVEKEKSPYFSIGSLYELNYTIYNFGNTNLSNISHSFVTGMYPVDGMIIENISVNAQDTFTLQAGKFITILVSVRILNTSASLIPLLFLRTEHGDNFQYDINSPESLATPQIELYKQTNIKNIFREDALEVSIRLKNTGDCVLYDILIQEDQLVKSEQLRFLKGNLSVNIPVLNPGQEFNYSYHISPISLGRVVLPPCSAQFMQNWVHYSESNAIKITVYPAKREMGLIILSISAISQIIINRRKKILVLSLEKHIRRDLN